MRDSYFEKAINFGLGVVSYSKEKVEKITDEMVKKGELSKEQAKKMMDRIQEQGKTEKDALNQRLDAIIEQRLSHFATKEDVREIIREELHKLHEEHHPRATEIKSAEFEAKSDLADF